MSNQEPDLINCEKWWKITKHVSLMQSKRFMRIYGSEIGEWIGDSGFEPSVGSLTTTRQCIGVSCLKKKKLGSSSWGVRGDLSFS